MNIFLIVIIVMSITCPKISYSQDLNTDSTNRSSSPYTLIYLGLGSGIKYQSIGGIREEGVSPSGLLSIMTNTNERKTEFLGIELKYYRYGYNTKNHLDNVFFLTPFYQWNTKLFWNINLIMQVGISILSNNAVLFFTNSLDLGIKYQINNIGLFAKNNFNINYLLLTNIVSIINIGVYIIL